MFLMVSFPIKTLNISVLYSKHVKNYCEMKINMLISSEANSPGILCLQSKSNDSRQLN